jgi:hypothetical protein
MYNVRMKRVTASEARRNWFRLLDEVIAGETVVVERKGWRVVLRREKQSSEGKIPDYSGLLRSGDLELADRWGWRWSPDEELEFVESPE